MLNLKELNWIKIAKTLIVMFISLFIFYLLIDQVIMPAYTRHGQAIEVPDLTNLMYEDAREVLSRIDLQIVEEMKKFDTSNEFPIGVVMAQNPKPGSTVKKSRRIYVIVSKGEPTIEMPKLIGESERNAIFIIKNLGLVLREVYYVTSDTSNNPHIGKVINQSIPVGREVKIGTLVDIIVISEARQFIVPDVIGRNLMDAKKVIIQAGLTIGEIYYQDDPDLLPETVIDQTPKVDEKVSRGDTLHLWVSKLPDKR